MSILRELPFLETETTTMVFYGFEKRLPPTKVKELIANVCSLLDEVPTHANIGFGEGHRDRGPKFGMLDKALSKNEFDNYSYFKGVRYFEQGDVHDCSLAVGIAGSSERQTFEIHFRRERKEPVDKGALLKEVLRHLQPEYGILYHLTVREGPRWFITGIWSSGMRDEVGTLSSEFRNEYFFGKKFADGYFRDTFAWNYLSPAHLNRTIEGVRFQDWVQAGKKKGDWFNRPKPRGNLEILGNGYAVWELTLQEVSEVRPKMLAAGLLMVRH